MSESIIRDAVSKLGLNPGDPDYVSLVALLRRMVDDVRSGRLPIEAVDGFFRENKEMIEKLMEVKGLKVDVDEAVESLSNAVKSAASSTGVSLLSVYMRYSLRYRSGGKEEKEEKETGRVI